MKNRLLSILLLALAALTANAQDFDPNPPAEPNAKYKVTVGISHAAAGTVSGAGSYSTGQTVTIRRSDKSVSSSSTVFYKFKHWALNGEEYTQAGTSSSFTYTVGTENAAFEAVYEEEDPDNVTSKVFLVADPTDACTFNQTSGQRYMEGNYAYLYYNVSSDAFKFQGWYDNNGQQVSTVRSFNYLVGKDDVTLTARFTYEPVVPSDPSGNQVNVANNLLGDMNDDGIIDITDAVAIIKVYINDEEAPMEVADLNFDKVIDVSDAIAVIEKYLNSKDDYVQVSEITLSETSLKIHTDKSKTLTASILPENATSKKVAWTSSDESVATVNDNGVVTGVSVGTCTITCTAKDGSGTKATCEVEVNDNVMLPSNSFEFNFNFKNYDAANHKVPNHEDANLSEYNLKLSNSGTYPTWNNDHITISSRAVGYIDRWSESSTESGKHFYRSGDNSMTIVAKVAPVLHSGASNASDFISNRGNGYNYMFRIGAAYCFFLHTGTGYNASRSVELKSSDPQILVVRVDGSKNTIRLDNITTGESNTISGINWGGSNNVFKFFYNNSSEYYMGDVYWMYYSFECLDDESIGNVIDYNDN